MTDAELSHMRDTLERIAFEAGAYVRTLVSNGFETEMKTSRRDLVTDVDRQTQTFLEERLSAAFPTCSFMGEEGGAARPESADRCFIVDPIDGTANLVSGQNESAVSIGYAEADRSVCGVVYNPFTDELFSAARGQGAHLSVPAGSTIATADVARAHPDERAMRDGRTVVRLHTDERPSKQTITCFGTSGYYPEKVAPTFAALKDVFDISLDMRRGGAASLDLCHLAAARFGTFFELLLQPWDYAAGICIIEEAGGTVTDLDGGYPSLTVGSPIVAGGNPAAHAALLDVLGKSLSR